VRETEPETATATETERDRETERAGVTMGGARAKSDSVGATLQRDKW
jgi:hypothetical protein